MSKPSVKTTECQACGWLVVPSASCSLCGLIAERDELGRENARLRDEIKKLWESCRLSDENNDKAIAEIDRLREALEQIAAVENKLEGGDWDEIETARSIAHNALEKK